MSYTKVFANACEADGIKTTHDDGSALTASQLADAFIAKYKKSGKSSSSSDVLAKGPGQARKQQPKVSADASGLTKAEFFALHREEVKKVHKTPKDCRQELIRLWNEHLKKPEKPEKKEEKKKKADTSATTSPKPMYHKFDEELSDEQAIEWNLKKIGVMGEKHVYVENTSTSTAVKSPSASANKEKKKDKDAPKDTPTPTGMKRKADDLASDSTSLYIALDQLTSWLMSLDQNTLKLTVAKIGKPTSGNKKDLVDHILNDIKAAKVSDKVIAQKKSKSNPAVASTPAAENDEDDEEDNSDDAEEEGEDAEEAEEAVSTDEDSEDDDDGDDDDDSDEEDEDEDDK